ncbi:glutathione transferase [Aureococcus anophagefferens]|nr:glutathione transferase [Aureococcus anophagefferens]
MPCRNRGEILRLMLEEAQVPYELEIVGFRAWRDGGVKATTPHGKLPVLRDYDARGADLGQEGAITRFLARKLGLAGRTPEEEATVDSLYCFWFATPRNNGVSHDGEHFSCAALKAVEDVGELARPPYGAVFRQNTLSKAERSLVALDFFEKTLADAGTGFLLGEDDICPDWADKFGLPLLRAFADRVAARPQIAVPRSPARMPRYARNLWREPRTYLAGATRPTCL